MKKNKLITISKILLIVTCVCLFITAILTVVPFMGYGYRTTYDPYLGLYNTTKIYDDIVIIDEFPAITGF
jgi:hypothetical protein